MVLLAIRSNQLRFQVTADLGAALRGPGKRHLAPVAVDCFASVPLRIVESAALALLDPKDLDPGIWQEVPPPPFSAPSDPWACNQFNALAQRISKVPTVAVMNPGFLTVRRAVWLMRLGVDDFIEAGEAQALMRLDWLSRRLPNVALSRFLSDTFHTVPTDVLDGICSALIVERVKTGGVAAMAKAMCKSRSRLYDEFAAIGLPPPGKVLRLCRVFCGCYRVFGLRETWGSAARGVGFPSARQLRRVTRRLLGRPLGGLDWSEFKESLAQIARGDKQPTPRTL